MRLHTEPLNSKKSKRILLSAAAAVILMLVLIRSIQRQGELLLFRYNLGFSIEEAGILYDFQTVMLLLVSLFVFTAVFFLILPPRTGDQAMSAFSRLPRWRLALYISLSSRRSPFRTSQRIISPYPSLQTGSSVCRTRPMPWTPAAFQIRTMSARAISAS